MATKTTVLAKCEAVAAMKNSHGEKIGEEVRFYIDGEQVALKRLHKGADYGTYVEGQEYEIEVDEEPGPHREKWAGRTGDDSSTEGSRPSESSPTHFQHD